MTPKPGLYLAMDNKTPEEIQAMLPAIQRAQQSVSEVLKVWVKFNDLLTQTRPEDIQKILENYADLWLFLDPKRADISETNRNHLLAIIKHLWNCTDYLTFTWNVFQEWSYEKFIKEHIKDTTIQTLAITLLTNQSNKDSRRVYWQPARQTALDIASSSLRGGFDGVISSPEDSQLLRQVFWQDFVIGNPWIRFWKVEAWSSQQRVSTPKAAIQWGANFLVMWSDIFKNQEGLSIEEAINRVKQETEWEYYINTPLENKNQDPVLERLIRQGTELEILEHIWAIYNRPNSFPEWMWYVMRDGGVITNKYTNFSVLTRYPQALRRISTRLVDKIEENIKINKTKRTIVVWAEKGSIELAGKVWESLWLSAVYVEKAKDGAGVKFDRHDLPIDEEIDVLICEDTISKWWTAQKIIDYIQQNYPRANITWVASVARNTVSEQNFWIPFVSLVDIDKPTEIYHHPDISFVNGKWERRSEADIEKLKTNPIFEHATEYVWSGKGYVGNLTRLINEWKGNCVEDFAGIVTRK